MNRRNTKTQPARLPPRGASPSSRTTHHSPLTTHQSRPRATKDELRARIDAVARALVDGQSRPDIVAMAKTTWGVGRRSALKYLKRANLALARDAVAEDRLTFLRVSQLQRDRFLKRALAMAGDPDHFQPAAARALATLMHAACRTIDARRRDADQLHYYTGAAHAAERQNIDLAAERKPLPLLPPRSKPSASPKPSPNARRAKHQPEAPARTRPVKHQPEAPARNTSQPPKSFNGEPMATASLHSPPPKATPAPTPANPNPPPLTTPPLATHQHLTPDQLIANIADGTLVLTTEINNRITRKKNAGIPARKAIAATIQEHLARWPGTFPHWLAAHVQNFSAQQNPPSPGPESCRNSNSDKDIRPEMKTSPAPPILVHLVRGSPAQWRASIPA